MNPKRSTTLLRYLVLLITLGALGAIIYGFASDNPRADTFIGGGTVTLFLVAMPLFLIVESRGKNLRDYMLTNENLEKMRAKNTKNTGNQ